ncbi:TPA: hypothetical protein N0F65_001382 [Lagenidium giganteum]|uniref:RNase H type-1 domain-containing protein n=1 Tax=Lagenidium giganteum TaxID=4803 RepID=A0AAV2YYT5_9STRA|nr:TPA: hypothetical protein N0F65_001382 [Lagenidium giganteum]
MRALLRRLTPLRQRDFTRSISTPAPGVVWAFADGACRGNPGVGGCGARLVDAHTQQELASACEFLGDHETNNSAEYKGLRLALQLARDHDVQQLVVHMDSELIIRQMLGVYRVKAPQLRLLHQECQQIQHGLATVHFQHIPREQNALADQLANQAIDRRVQIQ